LQQDICQEAYEVHVLTHKFFNYYNKVFSKFMQKIYFEAVRQRSLHCGDELFRAGEDGSGMFFIASGCVDYFLDAPKDPNYCPVQVPGLKQPGRGDVWASLGRGEWLCEGSLWILWATAGRAAAAVDNTELVILDTKSFHDLVVKNPSGFEHFKKYASVFAEHLMQELSAATPKYLTDIWLSTNLIGDLQKLHELVFLAFDMEDSVADKRRARRHSPRLPNLARASFNSIESVRLSLTSVSSTLKGSRFWPIRRSQENVEKVENAE